jgi:RNA polymerase sigma-70 factor (ECF subfamily)
MLLRRRIPATASDEELVLALRGGHRAALAALWDRYAPLLLAVGLKYLRDPERSRDEVVELFAGLEQLLQRHPVERFRPWVHTVMRNRCLQALRKQGRDVPWDEERQAQQAAPEEDDAALREATLQQLEAAIAALPPDQRRCITLFHLQRRSYQQTAEATGLTTEQVRSHLQNGRRNLRLTLQRHGTRPAH